MQRSIFFSSWFAFLPETFFFVFFVPHLVVFEYLSFFFVFFYCGFSVVDVACGHTELVSLGVYE